MIKGSMGLALALLVVLVAAALVGSLGGVGGPRPVALTIFVGSAAIQRAGSERTVPAHTGDTVAAGDTVVTGSASAAALTYPDGSITRLDELSIVRVDLRRQAGSLQVSLQQSAGLTWNNVKQLLGAGSFTIHGPNNASAEVRGTRFGYYVEHDEAGGPVVWVDVWNGSVLVRGSTGSPVTAHDGQRVNVRARTAPTAPVPIPSTDRQLSFVVFNQTIEAVTGTPFAFQSGSLGTGQASPSFAVSADGGTDLQFVLGWPDLSGSTFELTVLDPAGGVFARSAASTPPISVVARNARRGTWHFSVRAVQSGQQEHWWGVVGRG